jgi:cytochrome c553
VNARSRNRTILLLGSMLTMAARCAIAASPAPAPAAPAAATPPCEACHGAHGEGMEAAHVPRIAGQSADYLQKQLDDYASGARDNPIMANFAKTLSEQQRAKFAARYAAMTAPYLATTQAASAAQLARGHSPIKVMKPGGSSHAMPVMDRMASVSLMPRRIWQVSRRNISQARSKPFTRAREKTMREN